MDKFRVVGKMNHFCNRMVYFAIPEDYDTAGKSLEDVYNASITFDFKRELVENYVTVKNRMI